MGMRTKSEIEMNFSRALAQAEELETLSKELNEMATEHIRGAIRLLMLNWKGDNAELYCEKGEKLTHEMLDTADDLIKVAKSIATTADIVYSIEPSLALDESSTIIFADDSANISSIRLVEPS